MEKEVSNIVGKRDGSGNDDAAPGRSELQWQDDGDEKIAKKIATCGMMRIPVFITHRSYRVALVEWFVQLFINLEREGKREKKPA